MTDDKDKAAPTKKDDAEAPEGKGSAKAAAPSEEAKSEAKSEPPAPRAEAEDAPQDDAKEDAEKPAPVAAKSAPENDAAKPIEKGEPTGAAWAVPLVRFDAWWTKLEARLVLAVLAAEIFSITLWVLLKGLSNAYQPGSPDVSGLVFRGTVTAIVLGYVTHRVLRPKSESDAAAVKRHQIGVTVAVVAGLFGGRLWAGSGAVYFSNLLNWLQGASSLTLIGGLRGVATRLTLWVALLGASLATGQGKHINVDVAMRFLPLKMRVPVAVLGWMMAALVCVSASYGFVDFLAIADYDVPQQGPCESDPATTCTYSLGHRLSEVAHDMRRDFFLLRRQVALDARTAPKVLAGQKYSDYLHAAGWNEWFDAGDWTAYFPADAVAGQRMDESDPAATRLPMLNVPGTGENTNGLLRREVDFVFPFGLLMIALRFLLRSILAITGHVKVDPDAAHDDPGIESAHPDKEAT